MEEADQREMEGKRRHCAQAVNSVPRGEDQELRGVLRGHKRRQKPPRYHFQNRTATPMALAPQQRDTTRSRAALGCSLLSTGTSGASPGCPAPAPLVGGPGYSGWWATAEGKGHRAHLRQLHGTLLTLPSLPTAESPGHQRPGPQGPRRQTYMNR